MRVGATADLHGYLPPIPNGLDLLIIAGDIGAFAGNSLESFGGVSRSMQDFSDWMEDADCPVVGVAGNHDFTFERDPFLPINLPWRYLLDSSVEIDGLVIYGTPWVPVLEDWAFYGGDDETMWETFKCIPDATQILVSHGPPYGIGDALPNGRPVGSVALRDRVVELENLRLHVFGHIHSAGGYEKGVHKNVAYVGEDYQPAREIQVYDL